MRTEVLQDDLRHKSHLPGLLVHVHLHFECRSPVGPPGRLAEQLLIDSCGGLDLFRHAAWVPQLCAYGHPVRRGRMMRTAVGTWEVRIRATTRNVVVWRFGGHCPRLRTYRPNLIPAGPLRFTVASRSNLILQGSGGEQMHDAVPLSNNRVYVSRGDE
jgi:hypothetical protein